MYEYAPCPQCEYENPLENRFCGRCGASLPSSGQLVPRREDSLAATARALPAKLGPTGKALAVGLTAYGQERFNQEIKRRTRVVRIFPNRESCLRLVTALAIEQSEEWVTGRRYLDMRELKEYFCQEREMEGTMLMER